LVAVQRKPTTPGAPGAHRPAGCSDARRLIGRRGEELAAAHLTRRGLTVLARNVHSREGEIDIVAAEPRAIVFVEVKTRRVSSAALSVPDTLQPLDALSARQRMRLRKLALAWLSEQHESRPHPAMIRFDAIGVLLDQRLRLLRLDHLEDAW
jgi:putative endonuclease